MFSQAKPSEHGTATPTRQGAGRRRPAPRARGGPTQKSTGCDPAIRTLGGPAIRDALAGRRIPGGTVTGLGWSRFAPGTPALESQVKSRESRGPRSVCWCAGAGRGRSGCRNRLVRRDRIAGGAALLSRWVLPPPRSAPRSANKFPAASGYDSAPQIRNRQPEKAVRI